MSEQDLCSDCRPVYSQFCDDAPDFDGVEPCSLHGAAPELLAACHQAVSVLRHLNYINGQSVEQKQIEAAIAKAEGR